VRKVLTYRRRADEADGLILSEGCELVAPIAKAPEQPCREVLPAPLAHDGAARTLYSHARMSGQRSAIAEAVLSLGCAFTAEELHQTLTDRDHRIGLATVYRALSAMQAAGTLATVGQRDGSALLARCARNDHHHHLVCTMCGRVVAVDCPLGASALDAAKRDEHLVTRHEITLYGLCATCRTDGGEA